MRDFIKIKEHKRGKSKNLLIEIKNYLTIDDVSELHREITKRIDKVQSVSFVMEAMENIDVGGLQLFYATQKKAEDLGIAFDFKLTAQPELENLLKNAGFEQITEKINN
jgi:MFS superfamily sulfate permease-like transporter